MKLLSLAIALKPGSGAIQEPWQRVRTKVVNSQLRETKGVPMQQSKGMEKAVGPLGSAHRAAAPKTRWGHICAGIAFFAGLACVAQDFRPEKANVVTPVNQLPDANAQMESRDKTSKQQKFEAANAERKKQIVDDSTKLLNMAIALKAEVDKTTKDTLSLNVIRKADEIEKLAHSVKEKMKVAVGPG